MFNFYIYKIKKNQKNTGTYFLEIFDNEVDIFLQFIQDNMPKYADKILESYKKDDDKKLGFYIDFSIFNNEEITLDEIVDVKIIDKNLYDTEDVYKTNNQNELKLLESFLRLKYIHIEMAKNHYQNLIPKNIEVKSNVISKEDNENIYLAIKKTFDFFDKGHFLVDKEDKKQEYITAFIINNKNCIMQAIYHYTNSPLNYDDDAIFNLSMNWKDKRGMISILNSTDKKFIEKLNNDIPNIYYEIIRDGDYYNKVNDYNMDFFEDTIICSTFFIFLHLYSNAS